MIGALLPGKVHQSFNTMPKRSLPPRRAERFCICRHKTYTTSKGNARKFRLVRTSTEMFSSRFDRWVTRTADLGGCQCAESVLHSRAQWDCDVYVPALSTSLSLRGRPYSAWKSLRPAADAAKASEMLVANTALDVNSLASNSGFLEAEAPDFSQRDDQYFQQRWRPSQPSPESRISVRCPYWTSTRHRGSYD